MNLINDPDLDFLVKLVNSQISFTKARISIKQKFPKKTDYDAAVDKFISMLKVQGKFEFDIEQARKILKK